MSEPTTTTSAPAEAPKAAAVETKAPTSASSASPTSQETAPSSSDSSKSSAKAAKSSSFIKSALSALQGDKEPEATPEPLSVSDDKASTPQTEQPSATSETKTASSINDEDDAKAEADIKRETANMSASHRAAFTKLRYEARDLKRQLKAATEAKEQASGETQKAEANVELERVKAEYEAMKARVGEFEKESFASRVEMSQKFKKEVEEPKNAVASAVSEIAKRYADIDPESIILAVRYGDTERVSRITADMSEFDRFRFYGLVDQYQQISRAEESLRANAREVIEQQARQQREREELAESERKSAWESAVPSAWAKIEEDFPVLSPVDGDEDWNGKLETVKSFAKPGRFEALTVREQAEALYRAAAFPVLVAELETTVEELKAAQERLSKFDGATPEVQSDSSPSSSGSLSSGNFMEGALSALRKAGAR